MDVPFRYKVSIMAKVMLSIPDAFLKEIDSAAGRTHRGRSELIREALRVYLNRTADLSRPLDDPRIRAAFSTLDDLGRRWKSGWKAVDAIRKQRARKSG